MGYSISLSELVCTVINHCAIVAITQSRILVSQLKSEISERYLLFIFTATSGTLLHIIVTCPVQIINQMPHDLLTEKKEKNSNTKTPKSQVFKVKEKIPYTNISKATYFLHFPHSLKTTSKRKTSTLQKSLLRE